MTAHWLVAGILFLAAVGLVAYLFFGWINELNRRLQALSRQVAALEHVPFERPPLPVDNVKDTGVPMPADQDDLEAWAQEQELLGRKISDQELNLQRQMRYAEGL